jgi:hypothetical protein
MESTGDNPIGSSEKRTSEPGQQSPKPSDTVVGIPVSITINVPVSVPMVMPDDAEPVGELHGHSVIDGEQNPEQLAEALKASAESPLVHGAIGALTTSAGIFRERHPDAGIRVFFSYCAGVVPEEEI